MSQDLRSLRLGVATSHAKLILLGEHTVLYGQPAIALPVPSLTVTAQARLIDGPMVIRSDVIGGGPVEAIEFARMAVTTACEYLNVPDDGLRIDIVGGIPLGRGLGSSAATADAVIRSVAAVRNTLLGEQTCYDLVQKCEQLAHGRASGIDARTVTSTEPVWFHAGSTGPLRVSGRAWLAVADTGIPGNTRCAVAAVRDRLGALGEAGSALLMRAGRLVAGARDDLASGRHRELGVKMTEAHAILTELGVSCAELDALVDSALAAGALGAKLSGGGLGGCVVALTSDSANAQGIADALTQAGAERCFTMPLAVSRPTHTGRGDS
ncbi:mevalonate kinase [Nocardia transvalensis]|uniref:mevalonate kinase n=1 Tax=Nocardia transvalensis TaxID=37333 RepID=UPI001894BA95|nr:mevalonate kinase [Nocardia transvalensis]MBF6331957.1 mevalonate kinase [Nocardia transvalensis]